MGAIYAFLTPELLKRISDEDAQAALQSHGSTTNRSVVEESLQSTLDDKSGLYIIYQILRITCAVVIVFSLIAVIGLILSALWVGESVTTFIDKAKGLVGEGGSAAPGMARVAVISVAALGLGTAVATGVAMTNNDGAARTASFVQSDDGPSNDRSVNRLIRALADEKRKPSDTGTFGGDDLSHLPVAINLYPQFIPMPRVKLPPLSMAPDPQTSAQVRTYFDHQSQLTDALTKRLESLSKPNTDISVANQRKSSTSPELEPLKVDLMGLMSEDQDKRSLANKLDALTKNLELINTLSSRLDNLYQPQKPKAKNFLGRLFGSDRYQYFISSRSVEQLKRILPVDDKENRDNKPILNALEALSSKGTPVDEKTLLSELKKMIPSKDWNDGIEKKLELWKTTILAYTRIP